MADFAEGVSDSLLAGAVVSGIGLVTVAIHGLHGARELTDEPASVIYGVVLPLLVSLGILASGYWIARRDWTDVSPWRLAGWCYGGLVVGVILVLLLIQYQAAEQGTLSDPPFVIAMFGTYGAAGGLLLGRYDVQRHAQHIQLEHKTQRLDEFASIVSHDLRNPLNVAQGHVELARENNSPSHLDSIADALDRIESIIIETLALARRGEEALTLEGLSLADAANDSWAVIEAEDAELRVETDQWIRADPDQLRAVLENLFRNAVEHNEPPVTVTVGIGTNNEGFYVADDGDGIAPELRDEILASGVTTNDQGTGLGLAIVQAVADAHGWSVAIDESDAGGARFEFRDVEVEASSTPPAEANGPP